MPWLLVTLYNVSRLQGYIIGLSWREYALVHPLPKSCYSRWVSHKPDGRRKDDWVFMRRATLHNLRDVTIVLSKKRRNDRPKGVKILVTNPTEASVGACLVSTRDGGTWS
jgi:hypothetical protein